MTKIVKNSWALFTGIGIMMIAHGLQGNLMGVRSVIEEFNFLATGTMMSGYYVGYFFWFPYNSKTGFKSRSYQSFCSFCIHGILKYFNYLCICKSYCMDFCEIYNRNVCGKLFYCCRKLAQ